MNTNGYPTHMSDRQVRQDQSREYVRTLTNEEITQHLKELELERSNKAKIETVIQATQDSGTESPQDAACGQARCGQNVVCPGLPQCCLHGH